MENIEQQYPQKPILVRRKRNGHISITILSIIIFAITFSFILNDYYLISLLLLVLLLHELGHFLVMKLFNYKDLNMIFIPFMGAMVSGRKSEYSQIESALMILVGPIPGIILGAVLLFTAPNSAGDFNIQFGILLIVLNVVNLFPIEPLDGGQLFRILFFNKYELTQLIFTIFSSLAIIGVGLYINSWLLVIFGLLLGFRIKKKHKLYLIRKQMKEGNIEYESNYEDISNKTFSHIKDILIEHTPVLKEIEEYDERDKFHQLIAHQVEGVLYPPTKRDAAIWFKIFMFLLWSGGIILAIYAVFSLDFNQIIDAFQ